VEDTQVDLGTIHKQFGSKVAALVEGVTKLSKYDLPDQSKRNAEAIRKLLFAMTSDPRIIIIKLADRLHNLQTLQNLPIEKQKRIAKETLEIYAPIAERLGIWEIKRELEDTAFKSLNNEAYTEIYNAVQKGYKEHEKTLNEIIETIKKQMLANGFQKDTFEVYGRRKHIYSIYKKMQTRKYVGKGLDRIYDKLGIRVIVKEIKDCYTVLGLVHSIWPPIAGEFDDYIGMKLPSGYQSLHTAVKKGANNNDIVEFQIRTFQMHEDAEYGIAAHWFYKQKEAKRDQFLDYKISWFRKLLEENPGDDAQEEPDSFVSRLKSDFLQERVYTFTPNGDAIDLPVGATPIDFAYSVHTDIGHRCRGAKVNGKLVPLDSTLHLGDQVEILTTKHGGPSRDWLNPSLGLVKTQRARSKIKSWFKKEKSDQNLSQGRAMLDRELRRLGMDEINLETLAKQLDYKNPDEMFVDLGCGDLSMSHIINLFSEQELPLEDELVASAPKSSSTTTDAVAVVGLRGLLTVTAKCCNPMPGDPIVGYITRGRGATIHRMDCPNILRSTERERLVKVSWGSQIRTYPVPIRVTAFDRQGLMGDVSNLLTTEGVNIIDVNVRVDHDNVTADVADIRLIVEVRDIAQLSRVLTRIESLDNVLDAQRVHGG
jgi:GTP pyrophosphokinase